MKKLLIGICVLATLPTFACDDAQEFCIGEKVYASIQKTIFFDSDREADQELFALQHFQRGQIASNEKNGHIMVLLNDGKKKKSNKSKNYRKKITEVFKTIGCTDSREICVGDEVITYGGFPGLVVGVKKDGEKRPTMLWPNVELYNLAIEFEQNGVRKVEAFDENFTFLKKACDDYRNLIHNTDD